MKKILYSNIRAILTAVGMLATTATVSAHQLHGFVPENNLQRPAGFFAAGISQETYLEILDRVEEVYSPVYASLGYRLKINRDWENTDVNAYAGLKGSDGEMELFFPGGLPRFEGMTADAFTLVACHEVGHQLGGAPRGVLSYEGQSDYFSTLKCLRYVFEGLDNLAAVEQRKEIDPVVSQKCQESFSNDEEIMICVRSSLAGLEAALVIGVLQKDGTPGFGTPNTSVVAETFRGHPQSQCRLDTYFAGAVCPVNRSVAVNETDADSGTCSRRNGDVTGLRPLCWYKPSANPSVIMASN